MPITITTWNIQNFTKEVPYYSEKLNFLAATIQNLNSDIVGLQEVLDLEALSELANVLGFQSYAGTADSRGNRVAFVTRLPILNLAEVIQFWQNAPGISIHSFNNNRQGVVNTKLPRPALKITIDYNGQEIDIITAHLKSKLLTFGGYFSTSNEKLRAQTAQYALSRRTAEAISLRAIATKLLDDGRKVVLLGDFNDGAESATTQILYGNPTSQPKGPEDANNKNSAFQRADSSDAQRLFNVTKFVPENDRWTRKYNGINELLDHILASEGMMPRIGDLRQVPEMSILNNNVPNMIGEHPLDARVIPDHAPVTARFV